ncbi:MULTISPECIES: large exoprotein [unclassified Microbacterium]|uniref:large exoprotein n=1 Tax=unclassified Microbacterium TaxID=2609290 RepID=UPI00214AA2FF|nr:MULTISPECIES: large exoprotein [unclassified Microbacterium]MCR2784205.1 large exoprotein [Microbacterium sp. zg.B96]WIM14964.1 large exoprotein [Microbacterium sp. zg-B96]
MGGQVLGGGVIVAVAVVLWLVYLLPSWHSRHQYEAAERNAVRLNRALRVLAETSETPQEVHLELNARTAMAQQRLARQALAEREQAALEVARTELAVAKEKARTDAALAREQARHDAVLAREQARAQAEAARAETAAARERAQAAAAAARALPAARRARARRRARLTTTLIGVAGLGLAGWGAVELVLFGAQAMLWCGGAVAAVSVLLLDRMARVRTRGVVAVALAPEVRQSVAGEVQDVTLADERAWTPRELPRPLTASSGSRAAAALDAAAARDELRRAAREEAMRERAERDAPPSIGAARAARAALSDDAEIEAHVRDLLARRASGQ